MWKWLILVAVILGIARLSMRRPDCVIKSRNGRVSIKGRMTRSRQVRVEEYLRKHFADVARLQIDVNYPKRDRRLQIHIRGSLSEGEKQMIRNFLHTES